MWGSDLPCSMFWGNNSKFCFGALKRNFAPCSTFWGLNFHIAHSGENNLKFQFGVLKQNVSPCSTLGGRQSQSLMFIQKTEKTKQGQDNDNNESAFASHLFSHFFLCLHSMVLTISFCIPWCQQSFSAFCGSPNCILHSVGHQTAFRVLGWQVAFHVLGWQVAFHVLWKISQNSIFKRKKLNWPHISSPLLSKNVAPNTKCGSLLFLGKNVS